ncbi:MAG: glycosyltransferase family 4 protein [Ignavibacteria bacterium]|nr:glycosyltransferase family 4 protein [Ignavibacteria bacterium]
MKILFITDGLGNGGKERQLIEILKHLDGNKFLKFLLTFNANQHYTEAAKNNSDSFCYIDKSKNKLDPFFYAFEIFERFKPDIVHVFDLLSVMYSYVPSLLYKKKILNASIQDTTADIGFQRSVKRFFLDKSCKIVANSVSGLNAYGVRGEVLYNIIDYRRFKQRRQSAEFSSVMVANFSKYKDYQSYLTLVKKLLEKGVIDKAYAVGDGPFKLMYQEEAGNYKPEIRDRIVFTGKINNIEDFLCDKNIGVLFSTEKYGEGISNSILEYMAAGLIPLVSDIGASGEIIVNGENGYLVNKNDIEKISSVINNLKSNPVLYSTIQNNALKTVQERFDVEHNIKTLERFYFDIMNKVQ